MATRTRERHAAVQQLLSNGLTISAISKKLSLDRKTVRRFAHAHEIDELLTTTRTAGPTLLSEHETYLRERFAAGCTDAARLTARSPNAATAAAPEPSAGSWHHFAPNAERRTRPAPPPAPSPRQVTGWLTSRPDRLTDANSRRLAEILERSPALTVLREHVRGFAEIMVERRGLELLGWMSDVDATGSPALRSFTAGLRRDLDAVAAGLTLEHNSGPVEGHVNRIKMLKRQMYGRANLDLLRKRVLHLE
ncbi:transposase (plasmid) [Rhodococcus pyridinivorans]|nr:transposase [Rhodococcus pyridinivorans]USI93070.1 transposase [Rhodococcus pyridinivorans]